MCGIAGFVAVEPQAAEALADSARRMIAQIRHRGPDDQGVWCDADAAVVLGHCRLAVVDLSLHGHQPMLSASGRYVIAFNGEIYNHRALRQQLDTARATAWRGHSDTEVLLAAIEHWGLEKALTRAVGMFAFALWDRTARELYLARDRLGEKPLYYGWIGRTLLFASELKALRAHPAWQTHIDRAALTLYLRHNCIPAPHSIYQGIYKLPPGTYLRLPWQADQGLRRPPPPPQVYWSIERAWYDAQREPITGSAAEATAQLENLLQHTLSEQMIADVPLGAWLSGGIDSSTITALMQAASSRPIKTFTLGFTPSDYDEARHARAIAKHLGTDHTECYVTPEMARAVIPQLPFWYDEPFADSSQIPTALVCAMTRQHVTVALTGDGGDELFAGYNRHVWAQRLATFMRVIPLPLRKTLAQIVSSVPPQRWDHVLACCQPLLPRRFHARQAGDKLHKLAEALRAESPASLYRAITAHWSMPEQIVLGAAIPVTADFRLLDLPLPQQMRLLDLLEYLPHDILVKVDRAAMGVSLETRAPFLDHRLVEWALRVPWPLLCRDGRGKWLLRQVLARHVPPTLTERPKMGFALPLGEWLRGPLRDWTEHLLSPERLRREGFFDPAPITALWQAHLAGQCNGAYHLWDILMFQAWLEFWEKPAS